MARSRLAVLATLAAAAALVAVPAGAAPTANGCEPTLDDGFGPFGRGMPPLRSKIGTGHVLSGVIRSAIACAPLARARVEFMQEDRSGRYTRAASGTVRTDRAGRFRFEGPRPTAHEGRPGHIHIRVIAAGHKPLLARYDVLPGSRGGNVTLTLEPDDL